MSHDMKTQLMFSLGGIAVGLMLSSLMILFAWTIEFLVGKLADLFNR